jgi:Tfp pilus assembly protein PilF
MIVPRHFCVAALIVTLGACATPAVRPLDSVVPVFGDGTLFGARPDILAPDVLHRLSPEQQADFLAYFNDPDLAALPPHRRLYRYLERKVEDFTYQGDTLTAAQAMMQGSGNCLSLAMVTTALAQVAGIEIGYQLMEDQPVFEYQGNTIRKGVHVSTIVYNPEWLAAAGNTAAQFSMSRGYRIDYFPSLRGRLVANLSYTEYLALYYSNMASDAILASDYNAAYWYLQEALGQDPDHPASLNMLAVVYGRAGDAVTAEEIYRYGIAYAEDKLSLLKNYHLLLVNTGRPLEAAQIQAQLNTMEDPSPYHWLQLARESQAAGDWDDAAKYYGRAIELAPYMDEAYLGLAQAYYGAGRLRNAERALIDATEFAGRVSTRNLYEAKLAALRGEF